MPDRLILEIGMGTDLHGMDYTKAACRAVEDALCHSSLNIFKSLNLEMSIMQIKVTIAVQEPEKVNIVMVSARIPVGQVQVFVTNGGQNVVEEQTKTTHLIAIAAIEVFYSIKKNNWRLVR